MGNCIIFCAADFHGLIQPIQNDDFIIAADGGLAHVKQLNIAPQCILGDFDSLGYIPQDSTVFPVEKDDTDTMLAVKFGLEKGYKNFRIFGGIGGRLDHTYANIQTASYVAENGGSAIFYGSNENLTVLKNNQIKMLQHNFLFEKNSDSLVKQYCKLVLCSTKL